ncbi:MAG: mercury resistance protein [Gammaproteobacteria bacterium]|nr:mercury resistance protein [Gammaproteobacteria bacterium]
MVVSRGNDRHRFGGYLAGFFAVLTCPCHIPLYALLLSGTAAGSFVNPGNPWAWLLFAVVFLLSLATALRLSQDRGSARTKRA